MCLEDHSATMMNVREKFNAAKCVGISIKSIVRSAAASQRLTVGLLDCIRRLSGHQGALFCLLAPSQPGDSAQHMQEVLLEAFCLENDIYIVKVDSAEKLQSMVSGRSSRDCSCVLIHEPFVDPFSDDSPRSNLNHLSPPEKLLAEHCEMLWGIQPTPIIRLPDQ